MKDEDKANRFPNYTYTLVNSVVCGPAHRYVLDTRYLNSIPNISDDAEHDRCPECGATVCRDICRDVSIYAVYHCECGTRMEVVKSAVNGRRNIVWFDIPIIGRDESDII